MSHSIVFTFIGADKPGLVERLTETVSGAGGNWLESRMSQLAGQFAGIARVSCQDTQAAALRKALAELSGGELTIIVQEGVGHSDTGAKLHQLNLIGPDRPGILKELSSALAQRAINVVELKTAIGSAPMSAEMLFEASAKVSAPAEVDMEEWQDTLDTIANELGVDIELASAAE